MFNLLEMQKLLLTSEVDYILFIGNKKVLAILIYFVHEKLNTIRMLTASVP